MEKVLVVGANGKTGTKIIEILKNHGQYDPIAMIRNEQQKSKFEAMGVDYTVADLEKDLSGVLNGVNKVIFAAGSGSKTGPEKTISVDQNGAIKLINEAEKHQIKKFVMLSAMGADNPDGHNQLQHYLKAKHNADEHLKGSSLNYAIVRPGRLTDDDHLGTINASEKLNEEGQITREDVAQVLVTSLDHTQVKNKTFEILNGSRSIAEAIADL